MEFEYKGCFYFSEEDEEEVLEFIKNGETPEQAVKHWARRLDDCDYYQVDAVEDQIISYIYTKI